MLITNNQNVVLGGPGCGKTTYLMRIIKEALASGVRPSEIAFVSFTKKAITEAIDRCSLPKKEVVYFKTLHALAFSQLGMRREGMINDTHLQEISKETNIKIAGKELKNLEDFEEAPEGDRILFIHSLAKLSEQSLKDFILKNPTDITWSKLEYLSTYYERYKETYNLKDFTDLLVDYSKITSRLPIKLAIIDEAQDLSTLQWKICKDIFSNVDTLYIAGDDDQAIYSWAGADVNSFLSLEGKRIVLEKSHRLTESVFDISQSIVKKISNRFDKNYVPREEKGKVFYPAGISNIDFSHGEWLILGRNMLHIRDIERYFFDNGVLYTNKYGNSVKKEHITAIKAYETLKNGKELPANLCNLVALYLNRQQKFKEGFYKKEDFKDATFASPWYDSLSKIPQKVRFYYTKILRSGKKLDEEPRITLSTIHASKGGECEKVLLITDVTKNSLKDMEDLHRVFFVGVTRAKQELYVLTPQSSYFYTIHFTSNSL